MDAEIRLPSTRYVGSKQKIVPWIWENIKSLKFDTFLDAFSGTSVVGYYAKTNGKCVCSNDILKSNFIIARAIIENKSTNLTGKDIDFLLEKHPNIDYPDFIHKTFKDIYFTDDENSWLDMMVANIKSLRNKYKKALAFYCLFQSCIVKRPYNLFHRKNLYMRFANVRRGFGNKTTWDTPFPVHFKNFASEVNSLIIDNERPNQAQNFNVFDLKGNFDLVYIDTPYFSKHNNIGVDYGDFYHFLEGLADYKNWKERIDLKSKHKRMKRGQSIWTDKKLIYDAFDRLFKKFKDSIIVVSYREGGIPNMAEMKSLLERYKSRVSVEHKKYKYVLSLNGTEELLFIAE